MNGDQILARVQKYDDYGMDLLDAMSLIFTEDAQGRTLIFLTRYSPFTGDFPIKLAHQKAVYAAAPIGVVIDYYNRSVEYSELKLDGSFTENVIEAKLYVDELIQNYMATITKSPKLQRPSDAAVATEVDTSYAFVHDPSDTVH